MGSPDVNGIRLPHGFTARLIARAGQVVEGTTYVWHTHPDGCATFATPDGGWIFVCNSELPVAGGVSGIRFDPNGKIVDAYRLLAGTTLNCSGGATPWGTWLSCEEYDGGLVWECDPAGRIPPAPRPALGTFAHEAAAVDPVYRCVYLTEDKPDGGFYRFRPDAYPDLSSGILEIAEVEAAHPTLGGPVIWHRVPAPNVVGATAPTRLQVPGSTVFNGGEGAFLDLPSGLVFFTTKGDDRLWTYDTRLGTMELFLDAGGDPKSPLQGVDNIVVSRGGEIFVCEDGGNMELVIVSPEGTVAPFLQVTGQSGSEIAGVAFDPSGTRIYFSSQRGNRLGMTYEVAGPFRTARPNH